MPCDSLTLIGVDLGKANADLMILALKELTGLNAMKSGSRLHFGRGEWIDCSTGESQISNTRQVAEIKRAYSAEVVKATARQHGWALKQTGPFKYEALKR